MVSGESWWELLDQAQSKLRGTAGKKLERMGELIYNYSAERFRTAEKRKKTPTMSTKSRRQQEIERLVKERRQLKKQWRKSPENKPAAERNQEPSVFAEES